MIIAFLMDILLCSSHSSRYGIYLKKYEEILSDLKVSIKENQTPVKHIKCFINSSLGKQQVKIKNLKLKILNDLIS